MTTFDTSFSKELEKKMKNRFLFVTILIVVLFINNAFSDRPNRIGTTTANFLEIGFGAAGIALGDAYVSQVNDISALYWNPAGLAFMKANEAQIMYQPWIADINTAFAGVGIVIPEIGTLAFGMISIDYGEMAVTTLEAQEGTGEKFDASEYAFSLAYSRRITDWFAFGGALKYITSTIWHSNANAFATDLGVIINTNFFSPTDNREDGLRIGMSISNYGTRMQYDGLDLIRHIDPVPEDAGNYAFVPGQYELSEWELPLIFRVGFMVNAVKSENHRVSIEIDALHPNNNAESVNAGLEYEFHMPNTGRFFLRGGYKALWLPDSEFGMTLGAGFKKYLMGNNSLRIDYAYRTMGILGRIHNYSLGFEF